MAQIEWTVIYRSPLADTKGVDSKRIGTDTDDEAVAKLVAQDWLDRERAHPGTRLVSVTRSLVHTEAKMLALRKDEAKAAAKSPQPAHA